MTTPPAGWYPSPDGAPNTLQYWDGTRWTPHRVLAAAQPMAVPPVTGSGMRRVGVLFSESWTIVRRAGWPILAIGLLLWTLWAAVVAVLAVALDASAWARLAQDAFVATTDYPEGLPPAVSDDLDRRATALIDATGGAEFGVVLLILVIATFLLGAAQWAAVGRLGAEAAAGRPATLSVAWRGIRCGALRILGFSVLIACASLLASSAFLLVALGGTVAPLVGVPLLVLGYPALLAFIYWISVRITPAFVEAGVTGRPGALAWSWRATRRPFWAVLGRYLLWGLVVGLILNVALYIVMIPLAFAFMGALFASGSSLVLLIVLSVIAIVVLGAVGGLNLVGWVPIWRDLTTDERYRAINPDGTLAR